MAARRADMAGRNVSCDDSAAPDSVALLLKLINYGVQSLGQHDATALTLNSDPESDPESGPNPLRSDTQRYGNPRSA
jgi:hypothetical protein